MALAPGTRLGVYEIGSQIGAGQPADFADRGRLKALFGKDRACGFDDAVSSAGIELSLGVHWGWLPRPGLN